MNRMTRKAVIGELRELKHMFQRRYDKYPTCLEEAIDYIYQTPQWTPVSEDLPKKEEPVIFCDILGQEFIGIFSITSGCWIPYCQMSDVKEVVAWMPAPKPYKK